MKMYLLSFDEETLTGLRLCGVEGSVVKSKEEFLQKSEEVLNNGEIGILLLTKTLSELYEKETISLKKNTSTLISEIPDINSKGKKSDSITRYVQDAVGIIV